MFWLSFNWNMTARYVLLFPSAEYKSRVAEKIRVFQESFDITARVCILELNYRRWVDRFSVDCFIALTNNTRLFWMLPHNQSIFHRHPGLSSATQRYRMDHCGVRTRPGSLLGCDGPGHFSSNDLSLFVVWFDEAEIADRLVSLVMAQGWNPYFGMNLGGLGILTLVLTRVVLQIHLARPCSTHRCAGLCTHIISI